MIIRLPLDIKSLYFNIKNDNQTGHTATVATPLKQGSSVHEELSRIREIPQNINEYSRDLLVSQILSKSRAEAIIPDVFVFDKLAVNGILIDCSKQFCIYVREETAESNFHCGRQKVHYPPSLRYSDNYVDIDNREVVNAVSDYLHDYAFIVEAFEYDSDSEVLNFSALIVGENGIPYSKVFQNKKGVGNKFASVFNEYADTYDAEIISLREHLGYENVGPDNYMEVVEKNKQRAISVVETELLYKSYMKLRNLTQEYPYALYDLEYYDGNNKKYVIVRFTSTKKNYFNLPYSKIKFCNDFEGDARVAVVTDITGEPKIKWFSIADLNSMNKAINSITYTAKGE